jgi:hypothetical protein
VDHLRAVSDGRLAGWRESGAIFAGPANTFIYIYIYILLHPLLPP